MKKITASLLTAAIMLSGATAFAADGEGTTVSIHPDTQYITVTGKIESANDRDRVTLKVVKADQEPTENNTIGVYQVNTDENGAFRFGFTMKDGTEEGTYQAYIKAEGSDEEITDFRYFTKEDVDATLKAINSAASAAAMKEILTPEDYAGMEMLGIDCAAYQDLLDSNQNAILEAVLQAKPSGGFVSGVQVGGVFNQALVIAQIKENKKSLDEDVDIAEISVDYTAPEGDGFQAIKTMYAYATAKDQKTADAGLAAASSITGADAKSFWNAYNNGVTKYVIEDSQYWTQVRDFIAENKDIIGDYANIDWTLYSNRIESACKPLVGNTYNSVEAFASALKTSIESASSTTGGSGSSGGGGGGGSTGSGGTKNTNGIASTSAAQPYTPTAITGVDSTPASTNVEYAFDDLRRTPWANTAVSNLVKQGIIDGYGDDTFRPEQNITRQEFVTIVIKAFYPDSESTDCSFSDVAKDSWAYPYISAASNLGLIEGIGDNQFGPTLNIKRQDMAVIIKNILVNTGRATGAAEAQAFGDAASVSDYAAEAVKMLRAEGIVNGDENNNFNPLSEATRAEAAVIIYNMLTK